MYAFHFWYTNVFLPLTLKKTKETSTFRVSYLNCQDTVHHDEMFCSILRQGLGLAFESKHVYVSPRKCVLFCFSERAFVCLREREWEGSVPIGNLKVVLSNDGVWVCVMQISTWYDPG